LTFQQIIVENSKCLICTKKLKGWLNEMKRLNLVLDNDIAGFLDEYAKKIGKTKGGYIRELIVADYNKTNAGEKLYSTAEEIKSLKRSQIEMSKEISEMMNMLNTYFKIFAGDETNSKQFYPIESEPHPWTKKSMELVESKIRAARYRNTTK
jgi:predicted DNA-binding protein